MIVTEWTSVRKLSQLQYQQAFDELKEGGYRLIKVAGTALGGSDRYAGIWQKRGGSEGETYHSIEYEEASLQIFFGQARGFRVAHINAFNHDGRPRFNLVLERELGIDTFVRQRLSLGEYERLASALEPDGWRLRCISGYEYNTEPFFACVWDRYAGPAWQAIVNVNTQTWEQTSDQLERGGFRAIQVCGYTVGGEIRFAGVWERSPGHRWQARHNVSDTAYQAEYDANRGHGMRLVDVSTYEHNGEPLYTTIWEDGAPDRFDGDPVKDVVLRHMQRWAVPGLAVSVARAGAIITTRTFGYANVWTREIVTPATRFRVAASARGSRRPRSSG